MLDVQVRVALEWTGAGRPVLLAQGDGLCDRGVGFDDSGLNTMIPWGIVAIPNRRPLCFATAHVPLQISTFASV